MQYITEELRKLKLNDKLSIGKCRSIKQIRRRPLPFLILWVRLNCV